MLAANTVLKDRYTIVHPLAEGGQGTVYLAKDRHFDDTLVALKQALSGEPGLVNAFRREALLLRKLRHRALPGVIDCFADAAAWFLVMDFVPGEPFSKLIPEHDGPFPVDQVLQWADQLLAALDYLHTRKPSIIHRDIKPGNINLTPDGDVVLLDFGGSREFEAEKSMVLGSHSVTFYSNYFSPLEAKRPGGADPRTDLYSLAATLYGMLTQRLPDDAVTRAVSILRRLPDPLVLADEVNPLVPPSVARILAEAMALQKDDRVESAAVMRSVLRAARAGTKPLPTRPEAAASAAAWRAPGSTGSLWEPSASPLFSASNSPVVEPVRNSIGMELILVPAGHFLMGSYAGEPDEQPVHPVVISTPFLIGRYSVTQAQWVAVMGMNPSKFTSEDRPVEEISWDDIQEFLSRLNEMERASRYRLPTEAEWEYACRAGSEGDYAGPLEEMAWFSENAAGESHPVCQKAPNAWGLHDMHGNVWEWCHDWYDPEYYAVSPEVDPTGPSSGSAHVFRGGGWRTVAWKCRSAFRRSRPSGAHFASLGFRVARPIG